MALVVGSEVEVEVQSGSTFEFNIVTCIGVGISSNTNFSYSKSPFLNPRTPFLSPQSVFDPNTAAFRAQSLCPVTKASASSSSHSCEPVQTPVQHDHRTIIRTCGWPF